jgi:hypothetical protein
MHLQTKTASLIPKMQRALLNFVDFEHGIFFYHDRDDGLVLEVLALLAPEEPFFSRLNLADG